MPRPRPRSPRSKLQSPPAEFSLDTLDSITDALRPSGRPLDFQTPQRKRFRRRQIADAMLVMNRERLGRLARGGGRTFGHVEHLPPASRRVVVLARAPKHDRESAQRLEDRRWIVRTSRELEGARIGR